MLKYSLIVLCLGVCLAQDYDEYRPEPRSLSNANRFQFQQQEAKSTTTEAPVAILKQINRHNDDGSYTYGYEAADGSFKIETKAANGDVKGKYGYFDGERVRVVEYGADRHGFQPSGEGITVPPPTLVEDRLLDEEEYEQPRRPVAQKPKQQQQPQYRPQQNYAPAPQNRPQAQPQQFYDYEEEVVATTPKPVQPPRPKYQQPQYSAAPVPPRPQFANAAPVGIVYADAKPSKSFKQQQPQYDAYENRQPAQFPQQEYNPSPTQAPQAPQQNYNANRPADFPLFTPVNSRADVFKKAQKPSPVPPRPQEAYTEAFAPQQSYQPQYSAPQPQPQPIQQQQPQRPSYAPKPQSRGTSILDQLQKDYALPQGGSAALHDISFGYSLQ
ncbi:uncharacterized protein [Chironomus tepperi]|uniref:uncharacterized protein isoform X2 n=1 Tax=Chironomus tepperi TaxID=113505 RepID=UPI00391F3100